MTLLIAGLVVFLGCHMLPVLSGVRAGLREKIGAGPYKGLFSLVSLVGLVLIVMGYSAARDAGSPLIWDPPTGLRHLAMLLLVPVFVLLIASNMPGRIKAKLKHPMLVAIKLWALAHLLMNGDLASILLFGAFLAWAVVDRISVKRRGGVSLQSAGEALAGNAVRNDLIALVGGLVLYGVFVMWLHEILIGVPVF